MEGIYSIGYFKTDHITGTNNTSKDQIKILTASKYKPEPYAWLGNTLDHTALDFRKKSVPGLDTGFGPSLFQLALTSVLKLLYPLKRSAQTPAPPFSLLSYSLSLSQTR